MGLRSPNWGFKSLQGQMKKKIIFLLLILLCFSSLGKAQEPKKLSELPEEIMCIVDWVKKCLITPVAGFAIMVAGIIFMFSGADPNLHSQAKNALIYIIVGLLIVWGAVEIVKFVAGSAFDVVCKNPRPCY